MFNTKNLRGQNLLLRCLETGFVTTAPALIRYQKARGIEPSRRELVGERASCQLDQGSAHDHLQPLRDGGQGEPMDFKAAQADEAVSGIQGGCSVIDNLLWMLVPWAVRGMKRQKRDAGDPLLRGRQRPMLTWKE